MRRVFLSFALANLSLLSAYVIAATWPDQIGPTIATVATSTVVPLDVPVDVPGTPEKVAVADAPPVFLAGN